MLQQGRSNSYHQHRFVEGRYICPSPLFFSWSGIIALHGEWMTWKSQDSFVVISDNFVTLKHAADSGILRLSKSEPIVEKQFLHKHSTSGPPEGLQRPATAWRPANPQPLGDTEVGCKVGLWRVAWGWPPLILLFYPLARVCAYWFSTSLVLASNSRPGAATLPTPVA